MNFVLDPSLFQDEAHPLPELVHLVLLAISGRHRIEVPKASRGGFERWAKSLGPLSEEILEAEKLSARDSARLPSAMDLRVALRQASSWPERQLTVADAVDVASKPFRVFLENGGSDRGFLLALFRPEDRQWIERRADKE